MTRFWIALLFVTGVSFAAVWMADNPGEVVMYWFGYRIDTSLAFLLVMAITLMWVMIFLYTLARDIRMAPKRLAESRQLRHYKRGLEELTYSVAELANANPAGAQKHSRKAQRLLGQTPMGLLVSAQIAKSRGDEELTRDLLRQMLDYKETHSMASRLLSDETTPKKSSTLHRWSKKVQGFVRGD